MRYKNIAISGDIGTGKSTLAKKLVEKLGWEYLNAGDYFRKWHQENNVDVVETLKVPEEMDRKFDEDFKQKMREESGVVFESRLAGWISKDFPETLKVLVTCEVDVALERVAGREGKSIEQVREETEERTKGHQEKFAKLYGAVDYLNSENFDLVIDSTNITPDQALEKVLEKLDKREEN